MISPFSGMLTLSKAIIRRTILLFACSLLSALCACGGSDDSPAPELGKNLAFESLDGTANQFTVGNSTHDLDLNSYPARASILNAVIHSQAELDPFRKELSRGSSQMYPEPTSIPAFTDPRYFETHTLVQVDQIGFHRETLTLSRVTEKADRVEVVFSRCSYDGGIDYEDWRGTDTSWFAIPRTQKKIDVQLQLATTTPPRPDLPIGWC